jgi:hypothetical protein
MALFVLSIGFLKNLLDLLADVMNPLNEYRGFFILRMNMGRVFLCGFQRECNINGTQGLESHSHLIWDRFGGAMKISIVTMLNIGEDIIPCTWMLRFVHAHDLHNHLIVDLYLTICLGVESHGFSELGVQQ